MWAPDRHFDHNFDDGCDAPVVSNTVLDERALACCDTVIANCPPSDKQGGVVYTQSAGIAYALALVASQCPGRRDLFDDADSYLSKSLECAGHVEFESYAPEIGASIHCGHAGTYLVAALIRRLQGHDGGSLQCLWFNRTPNPRQRGRGPGIRPAVRIYGQTRITSRLPCK